VALFSRKDKTAEIVKGVVDELTKAGTIASAMQSGQLNGTPVQTPIPNLAQQVISATPLPRPMSQFGAAFNPGTPLFPGAIDQVNPITGRAEPRVTQYQVAENLMISQEPAPFGRLEWAARNVDIISRCITIRIDDITKMEWSFEVSDDAIAEIMAEENCSHAKASNIARDKHGKQIAEMTEFWSNPFPLEYKNWRAFIAQLMWDYLVYDEVVLYPNYNLGGKCFGFDIIDPSTIKILRDDKGRVPSFPMPAYQQILFGYPRGEFTASPLNEVNAQFNSQEQRGPVRPSDSLNVFIGHPQTKMLYGFSAVEQCLQFTDLYTNRQEWLLAEYKAGSTPAMFLETDSALELWQLADNDRILNDHYSGMTQNRQQIRSLPGGAKVVQTKQIDEKYKSDYDEFIAKRIAAIFGVMPSQVGVVARAGLGGGKGAAEGESQSAETVSTKPTINFIIDMVNTLSRQHLGMDGNLTFNITDDTSSSDQLQRYKALSTAVNAGMLTLNDTRGELGMPLFDDESADEPFVLTANGPVFFKGQLEVDNTGETTGQTGPSSEQTNTDQNDQSKNPQGKSTETPKATPEVSVKPVEAKSVQAEELREFARFIKSRNKTGKWRAFDFVTFEEELADKLNNDAYFLVKGTVPLPENVLGWAEDIVKAQITDTPKGLVTKRGERRKEVAQHYAPLIQKAIANSYSGISIAITETLKSKTKAADDAKSIARKAIAQHVRFNNLDLSKQIQGVHNDGALIGAKDATTELGSVAVKEGVAKLAEGVDWSSWKPGNPAAAAKVAGPEFQKILDRRNITLQGIDQTTQDRIGTALSDGLSAGAPYVDVAAAIDSIINDASRAMMIAQTESNFAYNATTIDTYTDSGITAYDWNAYDPCDECQAMEDSNPHDVSDEPPPLHPNCMCYITANIDSMLNAEDLPAPEDIPVPEEISTPEAAAPETSGVADQLIAATSHQNVDPLYNPVLDRFPKSDPIPIDEAIKGTNPRYNPNVEAYNSNCARCVQNYELRRRGFDVTANAYKADSSQYQFNYINATWKDLENKSAQLSEKYVANAKVRDRLSSDIIAQNPEGARGFLQMGWKGRNVGHVINWEIKDGEVQFIDAQTSTIWDANYSAWKRMSTPRWVRIDDKRPSDSILKYIEGGQ